MRKTLTKHGDSYALVIDAPMLEQLDATPDTAFDIVTDGRTLVLSPVRTAQEPPDFDEALASVHARFGNAMKRLSE